MNHQRSAASFPWSNTQALAESLRNGELCLATAISQINAVMRESLKIIEEFASEQMKSNMDRKGRVERMDRLISELSEKCQGMQQALLYKEEKYDEKCREVERYKVICELSAKAAVSGGELFYTNQDHRVHETTDNPVDNNPKDDDLVSRIQCPVDNNRGRSTVASDLNRKSHTKLNQTQVHMSQYVDPLKYDSPTMQASSYNNNEEVLGENKIASHYVGGPCKRKQTTTATPQKGEGSLTHQDLRVRERLAFIGGINVEGPKVNVGPVSPDKLYRPDCSVSNISYDQNKRLKIALAGQSNEVMSSSRNAMNQIKQKFTEKDLHRQVAAGCYTRLSSRRKKEWPF